MVPSKCTWIPPIKLLFMIFTSLFHLSPFFLSSGVADQLQTNYASDLRSILKTLFEVMATKSEQGENERQKKGKYA